MRSMSAVQRLGMCAVDPTTLHSPTLSLGTHRLRGAAHKLRQGQCLHSTSHTPSPEAPAVSPPPQVGQMKRRPTGSDLELAFINAKAAQSPLTSLVKGVRGIFDKQQQQQQQ